MTINEEEFAIIKAMIENHYRSDIEWVKYDRYKTKNCTYHVGNILPYLVKKMIETRTVFPKFLLQFARDWKTLFMPLKPFQCYSVSTFNGNISIIDLDGWYGKQYHEAFMSDSVAIHDIHFSKEVNLVLFKDAVSLLEGKDMRMKKEIEKFNKEYNFSIDDRKEFRTYVKKVLKS